MRHKSLAIAATLGLAAATSGCGASAEGEGESVTIGYSTYTLSNPFFAGIMQGVEEGAEEHGYDLITTDANQDPAAQVTDIQNMIAQGADYIILTPADGTAIAPAINEADSADVPVIVVGDSIEPDNVATIQIDDIAAGEKAANLIVDHLEDKYGDAQGNVVNLQGLAGTPAAQNRDDGFTNVMEEHDDIEIVAEQDGGFDTQQSNEVMSDILQANEDIDAVFAANDAQAIGVSSAISSADRFAPAGEEDHIFLVGVDGSKPAIENVRQGVQDVSISQHPPAMAKEGVDVVAQLEAGETVDERVVWPSMAITTENINSDEVAEYGIWADEVDE